MMLGTGALDKRGCDHRRTGGQVRVPARRAALSQWCGIYYIFDT